jgi:hypothetical protein
MYAMKFVASFVFRTMMFPHNEKIVTIDQLTHYKPNHSANIDNILPLVCTIPDSFSVIENGPRIFKNPSLLTTYHGAPPLLNPSISAQLCVVSSNKTDIGSNTPLTKTSPHIEVPPVDELLPQEFPENTTETLVPIPAPASRGKYQFRR